MAATFTTGCGDTHRVRVIIGILTAAEVVRDVVDAIARNTTRSGQHECLHISFAKPTNRIVADVAHMASERLRALYTGPYKRVLLTYDLGKQ